MSKHAILVATGIITAIYVGAVFWLHYGWALDSALATYVSENNLNSLGDFLAGVFSPLAFLWLIATVFIQSKELSLQRDEIKENREVMKEQTKAAEAQATFLEQQTTAMREQTALLIKQTDIADQAALRNHQIAMFEKRIDTYNEMVAVGKLAHGGRLDHIETPLQDAINKALFLFDMKVINWMDSILKANRQRIELRSSLSEYLRRLALEGNSLIATPEEEKKVRQLEKLEEEIKWQFFGAILFEVFRESLLLYPDPQEPESTEDLQEE